MKTVNFKYFAFLLATLFLFANFFPVATFAATATKLNARIEPTNPLVGQTFRLILSIDSLGGADAEPELPKMDGIVVQSSSTFTNVSIVNGQMKTIHEYSYNLIPTKSGALTIPPVHLSYQGKLLSSEAIKVQVLNEPQNNAPGNSSPGGESASDLANGNPNTDQAYFTVSRLNKTTAYVGEQIVYTVKFYYRTKVSDISMQGPQSEGFAVEEMGESQSNIETINGKNYRVVTVRKALYPTRAGELTVGATLFDFKAWQGRNQRRNDIFDQFFNDPFFSMGVSEPASSASKSQRVTVLPLPENGKPANFSGYVGDLKLRVNIPNQSIARGSSLTLTTELTGTANLKLDHALDWGSGEFKRYEDNPTVKGELSEENGNLVWIQQRLYKTAIVPLKEGALEIAPLQVNYFNPTTKSYEVAKSAAMQLQVTAGELNETTNSSSPLPTTSENRSKLKILADDILPNHSLQQLSNNQSFAPWYPLPMLLFGFPLLPLILSYLWNGWRHRQNGDRPLYLYDQATKRALKRLQAIKDQNSPSTIAELYSLYTDFLKERLQLASGIITAEEVAQALTTDSENLILGKTSGELINQLEAWRLGLIAPEQPTIKQMHDSIYANIVQITASTKKRHTRLRTLLLLTLLFTGSSLLQAAATTIPHTPTTFLEAEQSYNQGDFETAKNQYLQAIQSQNQMGIANGHAFYNLGNCYFRLNQLAFSMLAYQRAKLFLPHDRDLQANLETVAEKLKIPLEEANNFLNAFFFWNNLFSYQHLSWLLLFLHWVFCLALILRFLLPNTTLKKTILILLGIYLLFLTSYIVKTWQLHKPRGLVIASQVELRSGKGDEFIPILKLNQGTSFSILEQEGDWWKIDITGDQDSSKTHKGYARATALAAVGNWQLLTGINIKDLLSQELTPEKRN
jgi:tetratricopeptide (TPR) repeat protein